MLTNYNKSKSFFLGGISGWAQKGTSFLSVFAALTCQAHTVAKFVVTLKNRLFRPRKLFFSFLVFMDLVVVVVKKSFFFIRAKRAHTFLD